jgi:2-oxoglutarate ferredoxin oxidoreductase subunit alpha
MEPLLWRIGGPQGGGIDLAASLFSRLCARHGLHVLARREYHSNITGRHSFSDARIGTQPVHSHSSTPQLLLCLDAETVCRHVNSVQSQACIVYAKRSETETLAQQKLLDQLLLNQISGLLRKAKLPETIAGLLEYASELGINIVPVDYDFMFANLRDELAINKKTAERCRNVLSVAVSAALLNLDMDVLVNEVEQVFQNKPAAITLNSTAVMRAYAYVDTLSVRFEHNLAGNCMQQAERIWVNGSQSVALGKLAAGLGIQTYYPISPATDESLFLESNNTVPLCDGRETGPVIIQTEDELAAITMACGAALTGARAATSTSGPGFSLMVEGLGWAGMNEVPVVINLYQRGGPSTGMPTRTEQGDLQFVIHAGHGEFPRMVLASGDVEDCFYDAFRAFNYAERYQLPVIHMLDKNLASSSQTLPPFHIDKLAIERGDILPTESGPERVARFQLTDAGVSPRPLLGQGDKMFWSTGVEHCEMGQVSENPTIRQQMLEKRAAKLELAQSEIPLEEKLTLLGDARADITLMSWGSNKGVMLETVERLERENIPVRVILVKLLWPFPVNEINELIAGHGPLIVMECNQTGQFNQLLQQQTGCDVDHLILKYTGRPFVVEELLQSVKQITRGNAGKILIHQNPYE